MLKDITYTLINFYRARFCKVLHIQFKNRFNTDTTKVF